MEEGGRGELGMGFCIVTVYMFEHTFQPMTRKNECQTLLFGSLVKGYNERISF